MKFTAKRSDILREAELALGAVEVKSTLPVLTHFRLHVEADRIYLDATDLDRAITTSFPARVDTEGSVAVPAKRFTEIVKSLAEGEVAVESLENHWITVKSGKSKFKLVGMDAANFPQIPAHPSGHVALPAAALGNAIARTAFAISNEESRYTLNGALLELDASGFKLVATDGHRLAIYHHRGVFGEYNPAGVVVAKKALVTLRSLVASIGIDVSVRFSFDNKHLFFTVGTRSLVTRQLTGKFPAYESILPKDNPLRATVDSKILAQAIARVGILSDQITHAAKLSLEPGFLCVSAGSDTEGDAKDIIDAEYDGPSLVIGFNHRYLLDFLGAVDGRVVLSFKGDSSAAEFTPAEGAGYRYIVMPMRV